MSKKQTIKEKVAEAADVLRTLDCAGLTKWGKENGCDSRSGFAAYKKALKVNGIDYNQLRADRRGERKAELQQVAGYEVTFITDATSERFAVCHQSGEPLWFGRFFDGEGGEQSAGEKAAALKAIWLASKVKEALSLKAITLYLLTDAEWLTWGEFNADSKRGGKARVLGETAMRYNVDLIIQHIPGSENPADYYTRIRGFKKWQDNDLMRLAVEKN